MWQVYPKGRPQDLGGGGPRIIFSRFGDLHVAKRHAARVFNKKIKKSPNNIH